MLLNSAKTFGAWKDKPTKLVLDPSMLLLDLPSANIITWADEKNYKHLELIRKLGPSIRNKIIIVVHPRDKEWLVHKSLHLSCMFAYNRYAYKPSDNFYRVYDTQFAAPGTMSIIQRTISFYFHLLGAKRATHSVGL